MSDEPIVTLKRKLEVTDAETEDTSSLQEYIESETKINEIADAVLGASDPTNCSYEKGYVFRQALYCCLTCLNEKKANLTEEQIQLKDYLHGICLGCTYECHANHELLELYTKRNFRCDCGNSKFGDSAKCKLAQNKEPLNKQNNYNHNFEGEYCSCNFSEIDPKTNEENNGDMNQCAVCEDWFHINHLPGSDNFLSREDDYEEIVCETCMKSNQFLWYYQGYISLKSKNQQINESETVDISGDDNKEVDTEKKSECILELHRLKNKDLEIKEEACCFIEGWREALCKCLGCTDLYKTNNIDFLLNKNDTITFYEELGKTKKPSEAEETQLINNELGKLNRVSRVEFLHNVNDFKNDLGDFLKSFADKGEVVKTENITEFFQDLEKKKKMKLENRTMANFYCK